MDSDAKKPILPSRRNLEPERADKRQIVITSTKEGREKQPDFSWMPGVVGTVCLVAGIVADMDFWLAVIFGTLAWFISWFALVLWNRARQLAQDAAGGAGKLWERLSNNPDAARFAMPFALLFTVSTLISFIVIICLAAAGKFPGEIPGTVDGNVFCILLPVVMSLWPAWGLWNYLFKRKRNSSVNEALLVGASWALLFITLGIMLLLVVTFSPRNRGGSDKPGTAERQ